MVLVVDDEAYFAAAFAQSLQAEAGDRLRLDFTTSPEDAIARATQLGPSLAGIVSDYDLRARTNGLALLAHVRREHADAKRILVTGRELEDLEGEPEFALLDAAFEPASSRTSPPPSSRRCSDKSRTR